VRRGLGESRARAQALIEAGKVRIAGVIVEKPSLLVSEDALLELAPERAYVSRGGLKLAGALTDLALSVRDLYIADIGASTGGFTDCVLNQGARRVYAIDVGHDQLAPAIAADPGVVLVEGFNVRHMTPESLREATGEPDAPDLIVGDLSFISLELVLPAVAGG
jgi:23S rRNA (cytidine1920-2'-O)/16S rRNA (cytidine1409-2'-O)-methyltransferase